MTLLSDDELALIRADEEKATPGPWDPFHPGQCCSDGYCIEGVGHDLGLSVDDIRFVWHARADVPALLAHITALGEKYAAATRFAEAYMAWVDEFRALPPTSTDFARIEITRDLMHEAEDTYRKVTR